MRHVLTLPIDGCYRPWVVACTDVVPQYDASASSSHPTGARHSSVNPPSTSGNCNILPPPIVPQSQRRDGLAAWISPSLAAEGAALADAIRRGDAP